jgi:zinc-ribbon family
MIIFGWGGGTPKDLGPVVPFTCATCTRNVFARYVTVTKWFRLFFIPIIPYSTRHFLACPMCGSVLPLSDKAAQEAAQHLLELTTSMNAGLLSEDEYVRRAREAVPSRRLSNTGFAREFVPRATALARSQPPEQPPARPDA